MPDPTTRPVPLARAVSFMLKVYSLLIAPGIAVAKAQLKKRGAKQAKGAHDPTAPSWCFDLVCLHLYLCACVCVCVCLPPSRSLDLSTSPYLSRPRVPVACLCVCFSELHPNLVVFDAQENRLCWPPRLFWWRCLSWSKRHSLRASLNQATAPLTSS